MIPEFLWSKSRREPQQQGLCLKRQLLNGVLSRVFEGQKLPPPKFPASPQPPPPKKILLSLQYVSNYVGKILQMCRGQCTHCSVSQNCVSKWTRLHLSTYSFKKNPIRVCSRNPSPLLGSSSPSATWEFSPK